MESSIVAPDNGSKPYLYTPLESAAHIRIIKLEPDPDRAGPLRFSFQQGALTDLQDKYAAISYTWGKKVLSCELHCIEDDTMMYITANLDSALRRFRHPYYATTLWADAICINQGDELEKSLQIPIMSTIYRHASRVLVWLGEGQAEESALNYFSRLSRPSYTVPSHPSSLENNTRHHLTSLENENIEAFLRIPYFSRRWILQELVANLDVVLHCGSSEITWTRLTVGINRLNKMDDGWKIKSLWNIIDLWHFWTEGSVGPSLPSSDATSQNIFDLLDYFENSACSDPRDRLYALCNLVTNLRLGPVLKSTTPGTAKIISLHIDYSKPPESIYLDFATSAVLQGYSLDVLGAAALRNARLDPLPTPSWVPRWDAPRLLRPQKRLSGHVDSKCSPGEGRIRITISTYAFEATVPLAADLVTVGDILNFSEHTRESNTLNSAVDDLLQFIEGLSMRLGECGRNNHHWMSASVDAKAYRYLGMDLGFTLRELQRAAEMIATKAETSFLGTPASPTGTRRPPDPESFQLNFNRFLKRCTIFHSKPRQIPTRARSGRKADGVIFLGIANALVVRGDKLLIPSQYNDMAGQPECCPFFSALIIRPITVNDERTKNIQYRLVGFAYLFPFFAHSNTWNSGWWVRCGFGSLRERWVLERLDSFDFSPKSFTVELI